MAEEEHQEYISEAIKKIKTADHILVMTYPLVKDPKLLLTVIEKTYLGMKDAVYSIIAYERLWKRIPYASDSFQDKLRVFQQRIIDNYNIEKKYINKIQELAETIKEHKESTIEFARKEKFVICSKNYKLNTITKESIKKDVEEGKRFVEKINNIIQENELRRRRK
jgi:hypothetical protein